MKNKMKIYLASPFFKDIEITNYKKTLDILHSKKLDVYAPMENEISKANKSKKDWATQTFFKDIENIKNCDIVVMLFYGLYSDSGTAWECGFSYAINKPVVVVHLHEGKSNCMINVGSYTNLNGLDQLLDYDFDNLPKIDWYNSEMKG